MQYSDELIQALFRGIYLGSITPQRLPAPLYFAIAEYLKRGLYQGYGTDLSSLTRRLSSIMRGAGPQFDTRDLALLQELRTNIYLFSAAKTYQQVRAMTSALITDDGRIVPFKAFVQKAEETYDQFNKTWLQTEYDTAIGQAQSAAKWRQIERDADVLPLLEYVAVLDSRTSEICRPLDGIIAPVGDPIWKRIAPLNHFNCRCLLKQRAGGRPTAQKRKEKKVRETEEQMNDLFLMNPGMTGYVFSKEHPYFDVAPEDKNLARKNFNLPIPPTDYDGRQ